MKKCRKCGALQSDDRTQCVDCGTLLGAPMTDAEESRAEAALDDKLDQMAERTADFHVPLRDKILGVLAILGIIAAIVLLCLVGAEKKEIRDAVPANVQRQIFHNGSFVTTITSPKPSSVSYSSARMDALDKSQAAALAALIAFAAAAPMLLVPGLMWNLDTLKYRLFYNWDTTPSYFALCLRRAATYILFAAGVIAILYGFYQYL